MFLSRHIILSLMPTLALGVEFQQYQPEDLSLYAGNLNFLPNLLDLTASLTKAQNASAYGDSWWTSSFLTGSDGHNYFVVTHLIADGPTAVTTRRAVLNLQTYAYSHGQNISENRTIYDSATGIPDLSGPDFSMFPLNKTDLLSGFRIQAEVPDIQIDLSFDTNSPALVNGGAGGFVLMGGVSLEWAAPAARTWGTLTINGTEIEIVPDHSVTWFDRQFSTTGSTTITTEAPSAPISWHWFELHIAPCASSNKLYTPLSAWYITDDSGNVNKFASVREQPGVQKFLPISSLVFGDRTWTSPYTNITYNQNYTLKLQDGSYFNVEVVTGDQEMHSDNGVAPVYEGYVEFTGVYGGQPVSGYGLVEIELNL